MDHRRSKFKTKIIVVFLVVLSAGSLVYYAVAPYFRPIYSGSAWGDITVSKEEEILLKFIRNNLSNEEGGIYTNYLDLDSDGDITKGHSVLSESQGLILLYDLKKDDIDSFNKNLNYIEENMILSNKLLSWRVKGNEKSNTSATIDDLRVVKALLIASEKWNDISYRKLAINISKGIRKELVDKYALADFNDGIQKSTVTTLCYLDLPTIRMLANIDYISWKKIYDESLEIINNGYISDDIPLYSKSFDRLQNSYDNGDVETLLSMIVILNKLEVGEDVTKSIEWIKNEFDKKGMIATSYSRIDGRPTSNIESTSIYSIIVQIASKIEDKELEAIAMDKVRAFQIEDPNSKIYGGYGSKDGREVYSYDNLNALLAFRSFRE